MTDVKPAESELTWEIGIPLATNPRMVKTMAIVSALSAFIPVLIMGVIFGSQGEWDQIGTMAWIFALIGLGMFVMFMLIMLIFFGNRIRTRFTVNEQGVLQETIDKVSKTANRMAIVAGALGRSPGTAGAGLIAMSREAEGLEWKGGFMLDPRPQQHLLVFRNAWRPVLEVYCTAENYAQVEALARLYMAKHHTPQRAETKSPLPQYLLHSVLILLACFPIFAAHEEFNLDIFVPLLMLAFALATLWLIPLFGYVVLLANVWILFSFGVVMLEERTSFFHPEETYSYYTIFSESDWGLLALSLAGMLYLSWLSIRALRGRLMSLLIRDKTDMGA